MNIKNKTLILFKSHRRPYKWRVLDLFYSLIRPLFVRDVDSNEDYLCIMCGKPVLRRFLTCSIKCSNDFDTLDFKGKK